MLPAFSSKASISDGMGVHKCIRYWQLACFGRHYESEHVSGVERGAYRSYFLQSGERLSEDSLAQYAQHRSLNPKCLLVIC